jgi:hypothetical protein
MIRSKYRSLGASSSILFAVVWIASANASNDLIPLRVVAFQGQQAPGTPTQTRYIDFDAPIINNAGETAFRATVSTSLGSQGGLWFEGAGHLNLAAWGQTQPDVNYDLFAYNDQANLVLLSSDGIWLATANGVSAVVKVGDAVPGNLGDKFSSFGRPTINKDGAIAFNAFTSSTCCYHADAWMANNGVLSLVLKSGFVSSTHYYDYYEGGGTPKINAAGGISLTDMYGIWTNNRGQFEEVAYGGMQAPGLENGESFSNFTYVMTSARGDVAFPAPLRGENSNSIWRFRDGQLQLVARQGDQAPGFPSGVVFSTVNGADIRDWPMVVGDSGDIAFFVDLTGAGIDYLKRSSIWRTHGESLQLVAQNGMQAPGFGPSVVLEAIGLPIMNGYGQVAFRASVKDTNDQSFQPFGIFGQDADGNLQLIVRTGETIDVDPGPGTDLRTINSLSLITDGYPESGYNDNYDRGQSDHVFEFNDLGQVAFKATFEEGGVAILVSSPLVPEPNSILLALVGVALISYVRSGRSGLRIDIRSESGTSD